MSPTVYDEHAEFYLDFVDRGLSDEKGPWRVLLNLFVTLLGDRLLGARVCDVACGEGYLGRYLVHHGAREVVGIDSSEAMIDAAIKRSDSPKLEYRVDDARALATLPDGSIDIVVSQVALQDIADHRGVFQAARRVLKDDGSFVFSLLHPCFQSPCRLPEEPPFLYDGDGVPVAAVAREYGSEGLWHSGGDGVRGRMGSYHRMVSTYLNDLQASGFRLQRLEEPLIPDGGLWSRVPLHLVIAATVAD